MSNGWAIVFFALLAALLLQVAAIAANLADIAKAIRTFAATLAVIAGQPHDEDEP